MMVQSALSHLFTILLVFAAPEPVSSYEDDFDHGEALTKWLLSKGGKLHENAVIRRFAEDGYGMFATGPIEKDDVVFEIPQSAILKPVEGHVGDRVTVEWDEDGEEFYDGVISAVHEGEDGKLLYDIKFDDQTSSLGVERDFFTFQALPTQCATVRKLIEEWELDQEDSDGGEFGPYVNYLKAQPEGQIPSAWTAAGQELLNYVNQDMPPLSGMTGWLEDDWINICQGQPKYLHIAALVNQRSWDELLVPIYDILQHRNGKWLNTDSDPIRTGGSVVVVRATRDIEAGEEIYSSYNQCADCQARYKTYGTPELLRDYGFVEMFPQRWVFPMSRKKIISFDIDQEEGDGDKLKLVWNEKAPLDARSWLRKKLRRLEEVGEIALQERDTKVPESEWDDIVKYYGALTTALRMAIEDLDPDADADGEASSGGNKEACSVDGTCNVSDHFKPLAIAKEEWNESRPGMCDYHGIYKLSEWESVEIVESDYQKINFLTMPYHDANMCFDLDGVVQICEAYRPHYHEMSVHYTARYLDNVKNALFVGGGDSMLLHEFLKYPSIEKVVGLELDQMVTRGSFKHFGTQPHWHNPKVEWWFGDATKSLLILPKEYFGSFDLVIVDLSETVMALTVTGEIDIMQALTLLLKPNGILLKNEIMYFPEMTEIFPYSLHLHFYDVPVVCSQSLVLGSRSVDFLRSASYDHGVDYLHNLLNEKRHTVIHDFQHNETAKSYCRNEESTMEIDEQQKSPGILMIVEAEEATVTEKEELQEAVTSALSKQNILVVGTRSLEIDHGSANLVFFLKEGYITARAWSEAKYCGFDIHLWSGFDKQDSIKNALIEAVGSKVEGTASAFRIVAGGMFGTKNWREAQKNLGPLAAAPTCDVHDEERRTEQSSAVDEGMMRSALKETLRFLSNDKHVAVVCGSSEEDCDGLKIIDAAATKVLPLFCPDLPDNVAYQKDGLDRMFKCQQELHRMLDGHIAEHGTKIDTIVVDSSANYPVAQILNEMFKVVRNMHRWLNKDDIKAISLLPNNNSDWRKAFVDMIRVDVAFDEPVFRSEVRFTRDKIPENDSFGVALTVAGDRDFLPKLIDVVESIEKITGYAGVIENVRGGELQFQDDFEASQFFSFRDYDNEDAKKQWLSQKQLGFQVVLQYEGKVTSCKKLHDALVEAMSEVELETTDYMHNVVEGDGCITLLYWSDGSVVGLWDGREHVDVNLYLSEENSDFAEDISDEIELEAHLELKLRDVQPRGPGRVVNFPSDITPEYVPAWTEGADNSEATG